MEVIIAALSIILVLILFLKTGPGAGKSRIKQLLNKMPGPPTYPIIGTAWELISSPIHRHAEILYKYNQMYGPIYRSWAGSRGIVTVSSPEAAETILASTVNINKSVEYEAFVPWLGDCLFFKRDQEWRKLRKLVSPAFSSSTLGAYFDVFKNNSEILVHTFKTKVGTGEFDVCPYVNLYALDNIIETGFGFKLNVLKNSNTAYVHYLDNVVKTVAEMIRHPWLFCKYIFDPSGLRKKYDESLAYCLQFVDILFDVRVGENDGVNLSMNDVHISEVQKKNKDLIGLLINTVGKDVLKKNMQGHIFAGHDTLASALFWAIQLLGDHTDVQEKVYDEVTRIFEGSDRPLTRENLEQMKYLDRVIKEILRLYPSGSSMSRITETEFQIGQYTIPAGITIYIQIYMLHRNPECYPNPEEFNPDNFLPERVRERHPYAYIPFSAGPRNCIGQKFAILEMKTALSTIIRNFKIKSMKKTKDLHPVFGITMSVHEGVHIELELRGKE